MTCRSARELIMRLDADEQPPAPLRGHLESCPSCSALYAALVRTRERARIRTWDSPDQAGPRDAPEPALTARIMAAVREEAAAPAGDTAALAAAQAAAQAAGSEAAHPLRLRGWAAGGVLIMAGLVVVQFSSVVDWLRGSLGSVIDVALGVMLGLALTIYILVLVGSNMESVRRALRMGPPV